MKKLLELIRPRTLTASFSPVILGVAFSVYRYAPVTDDAYVYILLLLLVVLLSQVATNIWNEYFDYKSGLDFGQVAGNSRAIIKGDLSFQMIRRMGKIVIAFAIVLGITLCAMTTWWLLPIGILSIFIAYMYSGGPYPISKTCYGEIVSGFTMGFLVVYLASYLWAGFITLEMLIPALPSFVLIGMIMLTNGTRDMINDEKHGRRTLPIVVGRNKAIGLMAGGYTFCITWLILWVAYGYFPVSSLIGVGAMIPAYRAVQQFNRYSDVRSLDKAMFFASMATTLYHFGIALGVGVQVAGII